MEPNLEWVYIEIKNSMSKNTHEFIKNNKSRHHLQKCLDLVLHIYYQEKNCSIADQLGWDICIYTHYAYRNSICKLFLVFWCHKMQFYKLGCNFAVIQSHHRYVPLLDPNRAVCTLAEFSYDQNKAYYLSHTTLKFIGTGPIHDSFGSNREQGFSNLQNVENVWFRLNSIEVNFEHLIWNDFKTLLTLFW